VLVLCLGLMGCDSVGQIWGFGVETIVHSEVPSTIRQPNSSVGFDVSWTPDIPTLGIWYQDARDAGFLLSPYVGYDIGGATAMILSLCSGREGCVPFWVIAKPLAGMWFWREPPRGNGLLTGFKTGLAVPFNKNMDHIMSFEYGWIVLHDVTSSHDNANLETIRLAYLQVW